MSRHDDMRRAVRESLDGVALTLAGDLLDMYLSGEGGGVAFFIAGRRGEREYEAGRALIAEAVARIVEQLHWVLDTGLVTEPDGTTVYLAIAEIRDAAKLDAPE